MDASYSAMLDSILVPKNDDSGLSYHLNLEDIELDDIYICFYRMLRDEGYFNIDASRYRLFSEDSLASYIKRGIKIEEEKVYKVLSLYESCSKDMRIKALASIILLVARYKDDYHNKSEMDKAIKKLNEYHFSH